MGDTNITLLPCPFCGGSAQEAPMSEAIECSNCGTLGPDGGTMAGSLEGWNKRVALPGWKLVPDYRVGMRVRFNEDEYRIFALGDKPGTFDLEPVPRDIKNSRWLSVHPDAMAPLTDIAQGA